MFVRNCWYVADSPTRRLAWSHEVDLEGWFARKVASEVRALDPKAARPVLSQRSSQAVTSETETTSHYFFDYGPHASYAEPALVEGMFAGAMAAFEEDRGMIEAQQRNLAPDQPFVPITADGALVRFRRLGAQRLRDEQPA